MGGRPLYPPSLPPLLDPKKCPQSPPPPVHPPPVPPPLPPAPPPRRRRRRRTTTTSSSRPGSSAGPVAGRQPQQQQHRSLRLAGSGIGSSEARAPRSLARGRSSAGAGDVDTYDAIAEVSDQAAMMAKIKSMAPSLSSVAKRYANTLRATVTEEEVRLNVPRSAPTVPPTPNYVSKQMEETPETTRIGANPYTQTL